MARQVGISVQQVRNYEQAGLLPAAARSAGGQRQFNESHARALVAARAMVGAYGWDDAVAILTAVHADDLETAVARIDRAHAQLASQRERISRALQAFELVVTQPDAAQSEIATAIERVESQQALRIGELADLLGVRTSTLRFWERAGLIQPTRERTTGYRTYDRTAARDAHLVRLLRQGDFPMEIIRSALDEMHSSPDGRPDRVGAELRRREHQIFQHSLKRLRANAVLTDYIDWREQSGPKVQPGR